MRMHIAMVGLLVMAAGWGCARSTTTSTSGSGSGSDAGASGHSTYYPVGVATQAQSAAACTATGACSGTTAADDCTQLFSTLVLSPQCAQSMETADCADVQKAIPSYWDKCLPPCTTVTHHCNGDDTITICEATADASTNMRAATMRCAAICSLKSATYLGKCATSYQGQTSSKGYDVCWCQ